jgi:hypothetical protein
MTAHTNSQQTTDTSPAALENEGPLYVRSFNFIQVQLHFKSFHIDLHGAALRFCWLSGPPNSRGILQFTLVPCQAHRLCTPEILSMLRRSTSRRRRYFKVTEKLGCAHRAYFCDDVDGVVRRRIAPSTASWELRSFPSTASMLRRRRTWKSDGAPSTPSTPSQKFLKCAQAIKLTVGRQELSRSPDRIRDNPQMSSEPSNRRGPVHFRHPGPLDIQKLMSDYPGLPRRVSLPCPTVTKAKANFCTLGSTGADRSSENLEEFNLRVFTVQTQTRQLSELGSAPAPELEGRRPWTSVTQIICKLPRLAQMSVPLGPVASGSLGT